jgi:hypothetical protein
MMHPSLPAGSPIPVQCCLCVYEQRAQRTDPLPAAPRERGARGWRTLSILDAFCHGVRAVRERGTFKACPAHTEKIDRAVAQVGLMVVHRLRLKQAQG